MKIPTATVSGDNLYVMQQMCRQRIANIAEEMRNLRVSSYSSEGDYECAVMSRLNDMSDIISIYWELNNTKENK